MKIPTCAEDVEEEWVQELLQNYCDFKYDRGLKISIKEFEATKGTKPGENFNGQLVSLTVKTNVVRRGVEESEACQQEKKHEVEGEEREMSFNLILKLLSKNIFNRELHKAANHHTKELKMYSTVIDVLNKYLEENSLIKYCIEIPEFYYGIFSDKHYVLAMENMKPLGYSINDRKCGLSVEQARLSVDHLARIHAASYSYEKQRDFLGKFPFLRHDERTMSILLYFGSAALESTLLFLKSKPEHKCLYEKLHSRKKELKEKYMQMIRLDSFPLMCLCHGDYWNNNLLFLQNDSCGTAGKVSIIDWQMAQWSNPLIDLHYMLGSSTTLELRKTHLEELKTLYHSTFVAITSKLGVSLPEWSYDDFKAEYDRTAVGGFLVGLGMCQGTLSKAGESVNEPYGENDQSKALIKVKTLFAKVAISLMNSELMRKAVKYSLNKMFEPMWKEMIEGKNLILNKRVLDLVTEAEENGLI